MRRSRRHALLRVHSLLTAELLTEPLTDSFCS